MMRRFGSRLTIRFCRMEVLPVLRSPIRIELLEPPFSSPLTNDRSRCSSFSLLTKYSPVAGLPTMKGGSCNENPIDVGMVAYIGNFPYNDQDQWRLHSKSWI